MEYIDKQSKDLLIVCLRSVGFSLGEAEARAEAIESEKDLGYMLGYLNEHREATVDELRMVHTNLLRKGEAIRINTRKRKDKLADCNMVRDSLIIRQIKIDWNKCQEDSYLREIKAFEDLEELTFRKPVTFFVGENGSGKSTLLESIAIACGFNPEGGTRNYQFSTKDTHSDLYKSLEVIKGAVHSDWGLYLRAESFYNVATKAEEYDESGLDAAKSIFDRYNCSSFHEQSHGESFLTVLENDIQDRGLYFLDEPEAALSPRRQLKLLSLIYKYANRGAQFIVATHSPILLATPDANILEFSDSGINPVQYEDTDVYKIVSGFVKNRDKMLGEILIDGKEY